VRRVVCHVREERPVHQVVQVCFWGEVVKFQIRSGSGDKMFSSAHIFNSQVNKSEQRKLVVKGPLNIEWIFLADGRLF